MDNSKRRKMKEVPTTTITCGDLGYSNTLTLYLGEFHLYFSYKTIVAYYDHQDGLVCSENI